MLQFYPQYNGLQGIQPAVEPDPFVPIPFPAPMHPQDPDPIRNLVIGCNHHAAFPEAAQILGGIK